MVSLEEAWSTREDCPPDLFVPFWHGSEPCVETELLEEISVENGLRLYGTSTIQSVYLPTDGVLDYQGGRARWI